MFKRLILGSFPFLFLLFFLSCSKDKVGEYDILVQKADSLFMQKKYEEAKGYYLQADELNLKIHYAGDKIHIIDSILVENNKRAKYNFVIQEANKLFDNGDLKAAQKAFTNALRIRPKDSLSLERLEDIKFLLAQKPETPHLDSRNPYKIIVGSFTVKSNATQLQQLLRAKGMESYLIPRFDGSFTAVSCASYGDIHTAYNHLPDTRVQLHPDAWVLRDKE